VFDNFSSSVLTYEEVPTNKIMGNACNYKSLMSAFRSFGPEAVVHLADKVIDDEEIYNEVLEAEISINSVVSLVRSLKEYPVKHVFFGSSSEVYGGNSKRPLKEDYTLTTPTSFTGNTKRYCESFLSLGSSKMGFTFTSLRFFQVYGNRKTLNPKTDIVSFVVDYISSKDPLFVVGRNKYLDLVNADSAASAVSLIMDSVFSGKDIPVINISSGIPRTIKDVCDEVLNKNPKYPHKVRYLPANPATRSMVGNSEFLRSLGWVDSSKFSDDIDVLMANK